VLGGEGGWLRTMESKSQHLRVSSICLEAVKQDWLVVGLIAWVLVGRLGGGVLGTEGREE
jgi:hypothetical protein